MAPRGLPWPSTRCPRLPGAPAGAQCTLPAAGTLSSSRTRVGPRPAFRSLGSWEWCVGPFSHKGPKWTCSRQHWFPRSPHFPIPIQDPAGVGTCVYLRPGNSTMAGQGGGELPCGCGDPSRAAQVQPAPGLGSLLCTHTHTCPLCVQMATRVPSVTWGLSYTRGALVPPRVPHPGGLSAVVLGGRGQGSGAQAQQHRQQAEQEPKGQQGGAGLQPAGGSADVAQ